MTMPLTYPSLNGVNEARDLRDTASRSLSETAPDTTSPASSFDLQACLADAAEELTFQFSEVVEAQEKTLEQRIESSEKHDADLSVAQVHAIMTLMEGHEGYATIRAQARQFAHAFANNPEHALDLLQPTELDGERRYALLTLAIDALDRSGRQDLSGELRQHGRAHHILDVGHDDKVRRLVASGIGTPPRGAPTDMSSRESYFQLLAIQPSVRSVFDAAAEAQGLQHVASSLEGIQLTGQGQTASAHLEQIGCFLAVNRLVEVVRTMIGFAHQLIVQTARRDAIDRGEPIKVARHLIDLGNTSVPSAPLEKLASVILGQCDDLAKAAFFGSLHLQVRRWPSPIWTMTEGKKILLDHLVRKQIPSNAAQKPGGWR
jgi:hypothetical protein